MGRLEQTTTCDQALLEAVLRYGPHWQLPILKSRRLRVHSTKWLLHKIFQNLSNITVCLCVSFSFPHTVCSSCFLKCQAIISRRVTSSTSGCINCDAINRYFLDLSSSLLLQFEYGNHTSNYGVPCRLPSNNIDMYKGCYLEMNPILGEGRRQRPNIRILKVAILWYC